MRFEKKYKIEGFSPVEIAQKLRLHPASFRKIFPDRQVNNIYFDTMDLKSFRDNVDGVNQRKKIRLRWYGKDMKKISHPKLEYKIKDNELGRKEVKSFDDCYLTDLGLIAKRVNQLSNTHSTLLPTLINTYQRSYFGTLNGDFRITLDRQLRYFSPTFGATGIGTFFSEPVIILEIKYDENLDGKTDLIFQNIPFRQTKSSKYVTGVFLVNG